MYSDFVHLYIPCLLDGKVYTMDNMSSVPQPKHNFTGSFAGELKMAFPAECVYQVHVAYALSLA